MNFTPVDDRVIVKPDTPDEVSKGGIVLPDQSKDPPKTGTVVAVGPGRLNDDGERLPMFVKCGDRVVFQKFAAADLPTDDDSNLKIMREGDIFAVIEE